MAKKKGVRPVVCVTAKDIEQGQIGNSASCPIARAVKRISKRRSVAVYSENMHIDECIYRLPKKAQHFVTMFDKFQPVKPFKFSLPRAQK